MVILDNQETRSFDTSLFAIGIAVREYIRNVLYVHGPWWMHCAPRAGRLDDSGRWLPVRLGNASLVVAVLQTRHTTDGAADRLVTALSHPRRPISQTFTLRRAGADVVCWCPAPSSHPASPRRTHLCPPALDIASSMHADVRQPEYFGAGGEQRIRAASR